MDSINYSNQNSILVCALQLDGKGDIYGAHEIALRVEKLLPHYKVVFTVLQPRFDPIERCYLANFNVENLTEIQKQENWEIETEVEALKAIDTFKRIIVFPTYHDSMLPLEILKRREDVIKLREYGVGSPKPGIVEGPTHTLGLAMHKGEKGVLLPMEFSEKLPPHKEETTLARLSHLKHVHQALSTAILGKELSVEAIEQFHKSSKLYFGYFSQPGIFFCYINALLRLNEGNVVIFTTKKRPEWLIDNIQKTLWKNGFGKINTLEFEDEEKSKSQTLQFKGNKLGKSCTLIFRGLSGTEMEAMLDATEDESLTTGDNSPLRFMAHRKIIAYDTRDQKIEYAESMIDLAAKFDSRFKDLLFRAFFGVLEPILDEKNTLKIENGMLALFKAMKDPTLKANWYKFIEEVFAKYDFTPELKKLLQSDLKQIV